MQNDDAPDHGCGPADLESWLTTSSLSPNHIYCLMCNIDILMSAGPELPGIGFVGGVDTELVELGLLALTRPNYLVRLTPDGFLTAERLGLLKPDARCLLRPSGGRDLWFTYPPSVQDRLSTFTRKELYARLVRR